MFKKYAFYLIRWQLSTPILAIVLILLAKIPTIWATVTANLIGGLIFFWVDRFIFRSLSKNPLWEIRGEIAALRPEGLDWNTPKITVCRAWQRFANKDKVLVCCLIQVTKTIF